MVEDIAVYVMTHGPACVGIKDYAIPLEIGAACRETHCCDLRDNLGDDNISEKDLLYCEITGLYWVWKNNHHPITGVSHYRRLILDSGEKITKSLKNCDIMCLPSGKLSASIETLYIRSPDHVPQDWEIMKRILMDLYPEYSDSIAVVSKRKWYYKCNIFITRKEILDAYCAWLFPLLFRVEDELDLRGRTRNQARAIGYLCEILLPVYIEHHKLRVKNLHVLYLERMPVIVPRFIKNLIIKNHWIHYSWLKIEDKVYHIIPTCLKDMIVHRIKR